MMTEAEAKVMQPQAQERGWPLAARRGRKQILSQSFQKEQSPAHTLTLTQ